MVEIRYGGDYEVADLAGKTVAEVREQYKQQFGISDRAQVKIGGKAIKRKHESETWLGDNDEITFARKSRKGLFFIGCALLAMAVTGGVFAYGATTDTVTLGLSDAGADFATVTPEASPPTWSVFGNYKGTVTAGDLFEIDVPTGFTGDMVAVFTLANAHDLVETYRILVLEIEIYDQTPTQVGTTEYLTLSKGECSIEIDQTSMTEPYDVKLSGGFYISHRTGWGSNKEDPTILLDVIQKGV
jgi:hypothetical protein